MIRYGDSVILTGEEIKKLPTRIQYRTIDHKIWEGYCTIIEDYSIRTDKPVMIYPAISKNAQGKFEYETTCFIWKIACTTMTFHPNLISTFWLEKLQEIEDFRAREYQK